MKFSVAPLFKLETVIVVVFWDTIVLILVFIVSNLYFPVIVKITVEFLCVGSLTDKEMLFLLSIAWIETGVLLEHLPTLALDSIENLRGVIYFKFTPREKLYWLKL